MGFIHEIVKGQIKDYGGGVGTLTECLVTPGQESVDWSIEALSMEEAKRLVFTLDAMAPLDKSPVVAKWIAKNFPAIVTMVQRVKHDTTSGFKGLKALGQQLTINMIRPQDIGGSIFDKTETPGSLGLYEGTGAAVYVWEYATFTAGTEKIMVPTQTMNEGCAVIHLGMTDVTAIPKISAVEFTLSGIAAPAVVTGSWQTAKVAKVYPSPFEYPLPVMVGPDSSQLITVEPMVTSGESAPALASLVCAKAEDFTL